jgi:hypothetical protein
MTSQQHKSFVDGVPWSVESAGLAALTDLGLSEAQIANYFSVDPAAVRERREEPRFSEWS